jgi:hypothetical protein
MTHVSKPNCPNKEKNRKRRNSLVGLGLLAVISAVWLAIRTGTRPSRLVYPCQQAALGNVQLFKVAALASIPSMASLRVTTAWMKPVLILTVLSVGSFAMVANPMMFDFVPLQAGEDDYTRIPVALTAHSATAPGDNSDLFYVQNATGLEGNLDLAVNTLLDLMASQELQFYKNASTPDGLIGSDDVVILKMNGQWDYRGGTNTDLIKSMINTIVSHPDGFAGEVVIADNGQGIGNLDRRSSNAYLHNQSAQVVAESFALDWDVSIRGTS